MDEVVIEWPNAERPHVITRETDNPLVFMASACRDRIMNGGDTNYHIFLNSIEDINKIILGESDEFYEYLDWLFGQS